MRCTNTAVTRGLHRRVRKKIRKSKYVDVFTLTGNMFKEYKKAKKVGESAEDAF